MYIIEAFVPSISFTPPCRTKVNPVVEKDSIAVRSEKVS
jgi:hypothetical protein